MTNSTTGLVELNQRLRELVPIGHLTGSSDYQLVNPDGPEAAALLEYQAAIIAELRAALEAVEPYLDAIVCYASTIDDHDGNRVAAIVRLALTKARSPS
jgi:hypothetical protein